MPSINEVYIVWSELSAIGGPFGEYSVPVSRGQAKRPLN
jgi:hypothetical protein